MPTERNGLHRARAEVIRGRRNVGRGAECGATAVLRVAAIGFVSLALSLLPSDASAAGVVGTRGNSLAIGDFDGDGLTDHAYGYPKWNTYKGKVVVVYGTERIDVWSRDSRGILGSDVNYNYFGDSIAAGDFDGDGYDDIAIGVPGDDTSAGTNVGSFHIIYGSSSGLTASGDQIITQDSPGIADLSESFDYYAEVLATGDFDCDGYGDLAVGIPQEDLSSANVGAVNVIYGSSGGLSTVDDWYHQGVSGVPDIPGPGDNFGGSLLAININGDSSVHGACDDLAVGVPGESSIETRGGAVHFFYGADSSGLSTTGTEIITQDTSFVNDVVEYDDQFSSYLNAVQYVDDAYDDLVVRVPGDTCGASGATGFHFFAGSSLGVIGSWGLVTDALECVYVDAQVQGLIDEYSICILDPGVCHCSDEFAFAVRNDTTISSLVQGPWMCTVKGEAATGFCENVSPQSGPSGSIVAADCIEASVQAWKDCLDTEMEEG